MKKLWTWINEALKPKQKARLEDLKTIRATLTTIPIERHKEPAIERVDTTRLNDKQKWMYQYVISCGDRFVSPTEVAKKYGYEFKGKELESKFSSPTLTWLVNEGLLEKNEKGHYKKKK
jgi:hypothetical protein